MTLMTLAEINHDILIEEPRWTTILPDYESLVALSVAQIFKRIDYFPYAQGIELSITLTNDTHIQELNREYRGKDKPTNVLSFPQIDWVQEQESAKAPLIMLGDVIIALETIEREAQEQDKRIQDHFIHMLIHSILHLCGHDHEQEAEAEEMESIEIQILSDMGIKNPYETL